MKKFLALAALVLGLASCQNEPEGLNIVTGGEVDTVITVTLPEAATRADWTNSAEGALNQIPYFEVKFFGAQPVSPAVFSPTNVT